MLSLALRNLVRERTRLAISVGGIAFAVALIVLVRGLYVAYQTRVSDYFSGIHADLWVTESGTADFFHSFSLLPTDLRRNIDALPGVDSTTPYVARLVALDVDGTDTVLYLVGFDPDNPATGPRAITSGTDRIGRNDIVVDEVFARQHGVEVGDTLTMEGVPLDVAGISTGGDLVMFQYAYATMPTARDVLGFSDTDNAVLVDLAPGARPEAVRHAIEQQDPGVQVRTPDAIVQVNQRVINDGFLPVIRVLLAIGFVVGVAVVGLTTYSSVIERRREYGVLKALGARGRHLLAVITVQSLLAASFGFLIGVAFAYVARWGSQQWVPQFITEIRPSNLAWVALTTVVMALVAATLPIIRVTRIDPAEVFRG